MWRFDFGFLFPFFLLNSLKNLNLTPGLFPTIGFYSCKLEEVSCSWCNYCLSGEFSSQFWFSLGISAGHLYECMYKLFVLPGIWKFPLFREHIFSEVKSLDMYLRTRKLNDYLEFIWVPWITYELRILNTDLELQIMCIKSCNELVILILLFKYILSIKLNRFAWISIAKQIVTCGLFNIKNLLREPCIYVIFQSIVIGTTMKVHAFI